MVLLVAALKKALGAFGWTESVRREPRNLLLQVGSIQYYVMHSIQISQNK
jgi:hypothetical protein